MYLSVSVPFAVGLSVTEYLGYAKALLDQYGLTGVITAVVIVVLAVTVFRRFFGGGSGE